VDDLVGTDIPSLGESLAADFAVVWAFPSMPLFVCLEFILVEVIPGSWFSILPLDFQVERNCDHIVALCMAVRVC
jgi:hypothetical protein